jgi:2-polyprenyl-3-methyl-5-hydroxy-6-metoxy-1,4-benzoquinol methylase
MLPWRQKSPSTEHDMSVLQEVVYQLNRARGISHAAGRLQRRAKPAPSATTVSPREMSYHTFRDLGIDGIFDLEPDLPKYQFPQLQGKDVLDVGCASGFFSRHFAKMGGRITSVDIDTRAVRKLNERDRLNLNILEENCYNLKFDQQFDFAFCGSLLLHVLYPMSLLRILFESLRPGGQLVLASAGLRSREPIIKVYSQHSLRTATSTDEAIWWMSGPAQVNMLHNVGFEDCQEVASFILASTRYACRQGYLCSLRHNVYHARRPAAG